MSEIVDPQLPPQEPKSQAFDERIEALQKSLCSGCKWPKVLKVVSAIIEEAEHSGTRTPDQIAEYRAFVEDRLLVVEQTAAEFSDECPRAKSTALIRESKTNKAKFCRMPWGQIELLSLGDSSTMMQDIRVVIESRKMPPGLNQ